MPLDVRSGLLAAVVLAVVAASATQIGGYTLPGVLGLIGTLVAGLVALSLRSARTVRLPLLAGRVGLAVGVLVATVGPRVPPGLEPHPQAIAHGVVTALLVVRLVRSRRPAFADAHPAVALLGLTLPCGAACWDGIAYPDADSAAYRLVPWAALALYAVMGVAVTRPVQSLDGAAGTRLFLALLALGGGVRFAGVAASPDPVVDVWAWRRDAPRYLLHGVNPYGAEYPDVYTTDRARVYGQFEPDRPATTRGLATYPPLPVYLSLPFAAAGLDVRYADVLCDVLAAGMVAAAGAAARNRAVGVVAAGAYLGYPFAARVVEQGWYEPMLAALFGAGLVLLKRGYRTGGLLLGLGLVGKQFGLFLAPACLAACRRSWRPVVVGTAAAAALCLGVFLVWDARAFLEIILFGHARMGPRPDSLTVTSLFIQEFGVVPPKAVLWAGMLAVVGWATARTPSDPIAGAAGMGLALLAFCLFNLQANYNYFLLVNYLLLFGLVGLAPASAGSASSCSR
ncbi:MAG: hypothetical protein K2X82_14200 [Gemmataceae bacterium]|nr:hypothetical protein [Gemmataceae bacterium]